ncbi:MAG: hypothetical protein NT135_01945, partial [Candidatus Berkelbacteria bacterium]|nr:hypothetical protein [Candidatus Berkelbacteria bacterium]
MVLEKNISKYNYEQLSKNLSKLSAKLLLDNLALYLNGKIKPKNQNHKAATSTKLIKKEDGYIPISKIKHQKSKRILQEIEGKIRAFYPWPKVWTVVNKKRVIIHKAHLSIINHQLSIILDIIQPEGKKPMSYEEYLKGNPKII